MIRQTIIKSALLLSASLAAQAHSAAIADHARDTIRSMQASAYNVGDEADKLHSFAPDSSVGNEARGDLLNAMQIRINQIGKQISLLETERDQLTAWEQQALDQTVPLMKDAATTTEQMMTYFNTRRNPAWLGEYRDDAARVRDDTEKVASTLDHFLKVAK